MSFLLREQLYPLLLVLVSILACLWFLSILGASDPYLSWCINHYMHIPSFKMPTRRHIWQLIQCGDYAFSIDLQDAYLHIPIVKHHCHFLHLFGTMCLISRRFCLLGWPQPLGFLQPSPNLFCSFAITSVSILLSIWMTTLS